MALLKLGQRPKTFKSKVTFQMLDGTQGVIECTFKYRTRSEFGAFIDGMIAASDGRVDSSGAFSLTDIMNATNDKNANYLMQILEGWNLDEDLNEGNLRQLADEVPAAAGAIMEAYGNAVRDGRLGN